MDSKCEKGFPIESKTDKMILDFLDKLWFCDIIKLNGTVIRDWKRITLLYSTKHFNSSMLKLINNNNNNEFWNLLTSAKRTMEQFKSVKNAFMQKLMRF